MAVVARELGPLLINLIVIVRSGSAMTTELGVLKINGEVRALEAQGGSSKHTRSFGCFRGRGVQWSLRAVLNRFAGV